MKNKMKAGWIWVVLILTVMLSETGWCQEKTDSLASVFLPGIVSTSKNEFGSCFSKDRKSFYFSRTIDKKSQLFVTTQTDDGWPAATHIPFCVEKFAYADPAFSPMGELYFISDMPTSPADTTTDYDIWKTSFEKGQWKEPINVNELNSPENEFYISFTKAGDVYFSSSRPGGFGEEDIYRATFSNGRYRDIENLGAVLNTNHSEYDPFIDPEETMLFFASSGRADSFGKADLYLSEKQTQWGTPIHFGKEINTPERDYCPYLTDENRFYFSSNGDIKVLMFRNTH